MLRSENKAIELTLNDHRNYELSVEIVSLMQLPTKTKDLYNAWGWRSKGSIQQKSLPKPKNLNSLRHSYLTSYLKTEYTIQSSSVIQFAQRACHHRLAGDCVKS